MTCANQFCRFCVAPDGSDVEIVGFEEVQSDEPQPEAAQPDEQHCHFHSGVEYVVLILAFNEV